MPKGHWDRTKQKAKGAWKKTPEWCEQHRATLLKKSARKRAKNSDPEVEVLPDLIPGLKRKDMPEVIRQIVTIRYQYSMHGEERRLKISESINRWHQKRGTARNEPGA